jgi:vanillate O-demethylase ferredoxin subunit
MKLTLRSNVLTIHRWTGLTIGLVILMLALTGALNLFRPAFEPKVDRDLLTVPACGERVPLDTVVANAVKSHGRGTLDYIRIIGAEPGAQRIPSLQVRFADPQEVVFVHPCTGQVIGERPRYGGFFGRVEQLHIFRYSEEKWVRQITAVAAIAFAFVLVGGGIYMWWPRRGISFRTALRLNPRLKGQARHMNLHKSFGVCASAVLLLLVLTGLPLAFEWYRDGIYQLTGSPLPPKSPRSVVVKDTPRISMEEFWQRVQKLTPDPAMALMKFPAAKADAPLEGFSVERGAPHVNARGQFVLDAYTGKTLRYTPYEASSRGYKVYFWTISFHTGQYGGLAVQALLLAAVLCVPLMAYTGLSSYLRRRRQASSGVAAASAAANS